VEHVGLIYRVELHQSSSRFILFTNCSAAIADKSSIVSQNDRSQQAAIASARSEPAHIKAYKATGLGRRGLWSFSQRNRAKALAQIEPAPDINQINLFDPRERAIAFPQDDPITLLLLSG
jgi:hypothetical protein